MPHLGSFFFFAIELELVRNLSPMQDNGLRDLRRASGLERWRHDSLALPSRLLNRIVDTA